MQRFSWIFGYRKGWDELNSGADIKILPIIKGKPIFKYIIGYVTPIMLIIVFLGALITPEQNQWGESWSSMMAGNGWTLDKNSIIGMMNMTGLKAQIAAATDPDVIERLNTERTYTYIARFLLIGLFSGISWLVYIAYRKRQRAELKG